MRYNWLDRTVSSQTSPNPGWGGAHHLDAANAPYRQMRFELLGPHWPMVDFPVLLCGRELVKVRGFQGLNHRRTF
jgi:hypothetical protein